jgi:hypothetical protein
MSAEKIAYRTIPAQDSHVDDDQFENVPRTHVGSSRARKYLWYLLQAALLCTIAAQGTAIMFLSQAEKDSCRSVRKLLWEFLRANSDVIVRRDASKAHRA